jgi:asparagine synthase (glutamine-hydrolysing)
MCGIAGFTIPRGVRVTERNTRFGEPLRRMAASLRHRGPDAQRGVLLDGVALGHSRLAIVDLEGGVQPMQDPTTGITIVFNGEIFNWLELRDRLAPGYQFRTRSDTEVILAAYLERGIDCVREMNGQFAFALWDPRSGALWLARDRPGICPLVYTLTPDGLAFASEAKALFAGAQVAPALDARGLKQSIQLWAPAAPRTAFERVQALPPATVARFVDGHLETWRYWELDLDRPEPELAGPRAVEALGSLLADAVRLRLRADVPVAAYLSGGLDSSVVCALAQEQLGGTLSTFSVAFDDASFDERRYQEEVAAALRTSHRTVPIADREIGELLPEAVEKGEQIVLRSAPAPFLRLSQLVRDNATKVVLTGEGSDEVLLGYDLYRETQVRAFWARQPSSLMRPALLGRLYPYLALGRQGTAMLEQAFRGSLQAEAPAFSHEIRWAASGRVLRFLGPDFAARAADEDPVATAISAMPERVRAWRPLARAQWLEMSTLLSGYLLTAQGDRMLMGHSVEGRFPFLDHRVMELAARMPDRVKLAGLDEKQVLKRFAAGRVPRAVLERKKFPYRAPVAAALAGPDAPGWARDLLSRDAVRSLGVFDDGRVDLLVRKLGTRGASMPVSEADAMALTAVATGQLLAAWVRGFAPPPPAAASSVTLEVR